MKLLLAFSLLTTPVMADVIDDVNREVNHSVSYSFYEKSDWRVLKPGQSGNCAAFAYTKYIKLAEANIPSNIYACTLRSGTVHAFTVADNRVMNVTGLVTPLQTFADRWCVTTPKKLF
jgi:predicted transglutaminase-like cysteine proteinase